MTFRSFNFSKHHRNADIRFLIVATPALAYLKDPIARAREGRFQAGVERRWTSEPFWPWDKRVEHRN